MSVESIPTRARRNLEAEVGVMLTIRDANRNRRESTLFLSAYEWQSLDEKVRVEAQRLNKIRTGFQ